MGVVPPTASCGGSALPGAEKTLGDPAFPLGICCARFIAFSSSQLCWGRVESSSNSACSALGLLTQLAEPRLGGRAVRARNGRQKKNFLEAFAHQHLYQKASQTCTWRTICFHRPRRWLGRGLSAHQNGVIARLVCNVCGTQSQTDRRRCWTHGVRVHRQQRVGIGATQPPNLRAECFKEDFLQLQPLFVFAPHDRSR